MTEFCVKDQKAKLLMVGYSHLFPRTSCVLAVNVLANIDIT